MDKELKKRITEFHNKLFDLQDERRKIEQILEYEYGVNIYSNAGFIDDDKVWVFGFDDDAVEECIKDAKEEQ